MQDHEPPQIKLRPDGSIDIAYYTQRGHQKRAEQAHKMVKYAVPKPKSFSAWGWLRSARAT